MSDRHELVTRLRELIAALERRAPRRERAAESNIAADALAMRQQALDRLAELDSDIT
jgi:hypothetical protein